jgi:hypothetical protein
MNKKVLKKSNRTPTRTTEEKAFVRAVNEGLRDLEKGKVFSVAETKAKFSIK